MKARLKLRPLLCALGLAAALGTPALACAEAACARWDVGQGWYAMQGDYRVLFHLQQGRTGLEGSASYEHHDATMHWFLFVPYTAFAGPVSGHVTGRIDGDAIELTTDWGGVYQGHIAATGRIDGTTYDKHDSTSSASWYSDRRMNCLERVAAPAAPAAIPATWSSPAVLTGARGSMAASVFAGMPRPVPASVPAAAPVSAPPAGPGPAPAPAAAPAAPPAPAKPAGAVCRDGFVRRHATAADRVCVTPASHARVIAENLARASRVQPGGGAYGPATCRTGYVWREAVADDLVCVVPAIRAYVREENLLAPTRVR
jgi:hypothetical protein